MTDMIFPEPAASLSEALGQYEEVLSTSEFDLLKNFLDKPLPITLRMNTLKQSIREYKSQLEIDFNSKITPIPFCPTGFEVENSDLRPGSMHDHAMGNFYLQEAASMLPVEMFDLSPDSNPVILDMAASPGGKTTHLVDKSSDKGLIIANDGSRSRIPALRRVLDKWGAINRAITNFHGDHFGGQYPNAFDLVLLDAPCSMQNLADTPNHPFRVINPVEQKNLSNRQFQLLKSAIQAAKPGGQVVYSTCTLAVQEDELVVHKILEEFGDHIQLDDLQPKLPKPAPALVQFGSLKLSPQMTKAVRLWPHIFWTTGFFTARFTKLQGTYDLRGNDYRSTAFRFSSMEKHQRKEFNNFLISFYGFDLDSYLDEHFCNLFEFQREIHLLPEKFLQTFTDLPIQSVGLKAAKQIPQGFQITHEFASRFGHFFKQGSITLDSEQAEYFKQRKDIFSDQWKNKYKKQTVLIKDSQGRVLGRGKILSDRLKNLLPTHLY